MYVEVYRTYKHSYVVSSGYNKQMWYGCTKQRRCMCTVIVCCHR